MGLNRPSTAPAGSISGRFLVICAIVSLAAGYAATLTSAPTVLAVNGVLLSAKGKRINLVSTDGRRLAQQVAGVGYLYYVNNAGKRSCRLDLADADRQQAQE